MSYRVLFKQVRYFNEAVGVYGVFYLLASLPLNAASNIGGFLGRSVGPRLKVHKTALRNLMRVMPELSLQQRDIILQNMWDNLGRTAAEFPHIGKLKGDTYRNLVEIEGEEYFYQALERVQSGQATIFFSGHFANWEICPKTSYEWGCPLSLMYRRANNPWVEKLIQRIRSQYQRTAIPKSGKGLRQLVEIVKQKEAVGILIDQKANEGIAIPLLGCPAKTAPAIATLALKYGCVLQPIQIIRLGNAPRFKIRIKPPLQIHKTANIESDTITILTHINDHIGQWIIEHPEQWFWVHKRWG